MTDQNNGAEGVKGYEESEDYLEMIKASARMAADHPERIDELRARLKMSADLMISNRPEVIDQFREAVKELDAFLNACKTGEVDPKKMLERMDKKA